MVTFGDFVFVKGEKKVKDDTAYCKVTLECINDEDVVTISCEPAVYDKLKKYTKYHLAICKKTSVWNGEVKVKECVIDAKVV